MKQLTSEPGVTKMSAGFVFALHRPEARRRFLNSLRPEATGLPLDLDECEIVADLDPAWWTGSKCGARTTELGH